MIWLALLALLVLLGRSIIRRADERCRSALQEEDT
jgi:hypothetical protein